MKRNIQNETGKKSFHDEIQRFEKTQFPAMKSDSLDRESALAVNQASTQKKSGHPSNFYQGAHETGNVYYN